MYGFKFREKGSKQKMSVVILADSEQEAKVRFWEEVAKDENIDIDKRTVAWDGSSSPLDNFNGLLFLHGANLDDLT
jgi:hypothetical protein